MEALTAGSEWEYPANGAGLPGRFPLDSGATANGLMKGAASEPSAIRLFTVGHSNHALDHFLELLQQNEFEVVVDVRSNPNTTYLPHFARFALTNELRASGIRYLYLGEELGGRPDGDMYYDDAGHVLYGLWAQSPAFNSGLHRLIDGCNRYRVTIMCSEENPATCHRRLLVGRALILRGPTDLQHLRGDGQIDVEDNEALRTLDRRQLGLFGPEGDQWKSTRSVSRRNRPAPSSAY